MERLTKAYEDGTHASADNLPCEENSWEYKRLLIEKLGAYEDTGLEPGEILDGKMLTGWIPVAERLPTENEYRVVCSAHSSKPFLKRFEIAYITDTTEYQFGYYDGYKWIDKCYEVIQNVVAWKNHEPFIQN